MFPNSIAVSCDAARYSVGIHTLQQQTPAIPARPAPARRPRGPRSPQRLPWKRVGPCRPSLAIEGSGKPAGGQEHYGNSFGETRWPPPKKAPLECHYLHRLGDVVKTLAGFDDVAVSRPGEVIRHHGNL